MTLRTLVALASLFVSSLALASSRNAAQESAIDAEVAAVDRTLVETLHEGNAAMDRGDVAAAASAYETVHAKAPKVAAVTRRLCTAEARNGAGRTAVQHCREAVAQGSAVAENHAALAMAILALSDADMPDLLEAQDAASEAARLAPDAEFTHVTTCAVAFRAGDDKSLETCSGRLRTLAPRSPETHLYSGLLLARRNDFDGADRELVLAHDSGLDDAAYAKVRGEVDALRPKPTSLATTVVMATTRAPAALAVWVAIMFVLVVLGMLLSDAATRRPSRVVRAIYRALIIVSAAMFWVTGILATLVLIGFVAVVALLFLAMVHATTLVEVGFGVVSAYVAIASIRALLGSVPEAELGMPVSTKKAPELRAALDLIAQHAKMPKIDEVYAVPDASIEVREIGGVLAHLRGRSKRVLVIGVASLDGLSVRGFEALVASELMRFRARDGAGGDVALIERASLDALALRMEARGVVSIANPAWWFVGLHRLFFERITEGAVALQDELADARAAKTWGSETLATALRHVVRRRVEIEARAAASVHDVLEGEDAPADVYARALEADVRQATDDAVAEIAERLERIEASAQDGYQEAEAGDAPAWSLLPNREKLERAMNERLLAALHAGIGLEDDQRSKAKAVARA